MHQNRETVFFYITLSKSSSDSATYRANPQVTGGETSAVSLISREYVLVMPNRRLWICTGNGHDVMYSRVAYYNSSLMAL